MEKIIIGIVVYVVWSFIKNLIRESSKLEKVSINKPLSNVSNMSHVFNESNKDEVKSNGNEYTFQEDSSITESLNEIVEIDQIVEEENAAFSFLNADNVYNGIIMAELLSSPKARRVY